MSNQNQREIINSIIEIFEDFLEERGITIPNEEKEEDPDASNIYGSDYGDLSDDIENLLINCGCFDTPNGDVTMEVVTKGKSGMHILIDRYGVNDYGVWFTDDPKNDTSGCSTRGSLLDIFDEIKEEL